MIKASSSEINEARRVAGIGVSFSIIKESEQKMFGLIKSKKTEIRYTIKELKLGTLDKISQIATTIDFDIDRLQSDPITEAVRLVKNGNALKMAEIIAVAILNEKKKIKYYKSLAKELLWSLEPSKLLFVCTKILEVGNYVDFSTATVLMTARRTTAPKTVAE